MFLIDYLVSGEINMNQNTILMWHINLKQDFLSI